MHPVYWTHYRCVIGYGIRMIRILIGPFLFSVLISLRSRVHSCAYESVLPHTNGLCFFRCIIIIIVVSLFIRLMYNLWFIERIRENYVDNVVSELFICQLIFDRAINISLVFLPFLPLMYHG